MTSTVTETPTDTTDAVETALDWGYTVTAPSGATFTETAVSHTSACNEVRALNRDQGGTAQLVYREVRLGPWFTGPGGDRFGVRIVWPDGQHEVREQPTRDAAERDVRMRNLGNSSGAIARLVSRHAECGPWLQAAGADVPGVQRPAPPSWGLSRSGRRVQYALAVAVLMTLLDVTAPGTGWYSATVAALLFAAMTNLVVWYLVARVVSQPRRPMR